MTYLKTVFGRVLVAKSGHLGVTYSGEIVNFGFVNDGTLTGICVQVINGGLSEKNFRNRADAMAMITNHLKKVDFEGLKRSNRPS